MAIGVNVSALSWITGDDIKRVLHKAEATIRSERRLTPPALLPYPASLAEEIRLAVEFAMTHLEWSCQQEWVGEFCEEVATLHSGGMGAAKIFAEKMRSISCPADNQDGLICGHILKINDERLTQIFSCPKCHAQWSTVRLMDVALSTPGAEIYVDAEALAQRLEITERAVKNFADKFHIRRKHGLIEVRSFLAERYSQKIA